MQRQDRDRRSNAGWSAARYAMYLVVNTDMRTVEFVLVCVSTDLHYHMIC